MTHNIYQHRRQALISQLASNEIALIATAPETLRNPECEYPYRHDSNFYYLTGFTEPQALLVLSGNGQSVLFCRAKDKSREIWDGIRLGVEQAPASLGIDKAYAIDELASQMPKLLANAKTVYYPFAAMTNLAQQVNGWILSAKKLVRSGVSAPCAQADLSLLLDEMRLIKDEHELGLIRQACQISAEAHIIAMQQAAQMLRNNCELREYHLEAKLLEHFRFNGAQFPAYSSIVGGGANACILHYQAANGLIKAGDLVLIDAGCEYQSYASDITRTFPANGKFTGPQKTLYQLVLAAQNAVIELVKPGIEYAQMHECASRIISQGLLDLGLLDRHKVGNLDDVLANKDYNQFYMHGTGHWMGMDVHDVGSYMQPVTQPAQPDLLSNASLFKAQRLTRLLQPNMVFTVEPGIYVHPAEQIPAEFWHIGIRIEDDLVVTQNGHEILTRAVPVEIAAIEDIMQQ